MTASFRILCVLLSVGGCTQFPQLDTVEENGVADAPYPRLLPLQDLIEAPEARVSAAMETSIAARVGALRARATRLTGQPVVDAATKRRMSRGVVASQ